MRDLDVLITLFLHNHFNELDWQEMEQLAHLMRGLLDEQTEQDERDNNAVDLAVLGRVFDIYY